MAEGEFCVVCGRTGRALVDGVCADCAADRTGLVRAPPRAVVVLCPTCGARLVKDHWERENSSPVLTADDLVPFLEVHPEVGLRRVAWEEVSSTATVREMVGTADVVFRGVRRSVRVPMSVRIEHRTCPDCSRKSGRYYTAVLQLRGTEERRTEKTAALRERLDAVWTQILRDARPDWKKAISWREALPEGWDVFFTDTLAARSVARLAQQRLGAEFKQSASLFGRKDGRDVYRVTFLLRIPRAAPTVAPARPARRPAEHVETKS
jgi:nonsense-mediated mRNA decay protein 3